MSDDTSMQDYLAQHPRMIGVLFTLFVLLSQTGTVAAGISSQVGP
ncbi:DUF7503 family protein [Halopiger xanaduensis]|uniref:Uncharacterized protein n=2 Tax=Halopiger TaxID=387342 RepID=F8DA17_HALXS|nr:hypothetical protein Halxa_2308 [Halopiger xanaduensis SH-6]RKD98101.1 hypothetical protein ATJ93_1105 [Halopiger aswanensis]